MAEQIIPVDVEKIMEEIRQEIKEKGYNDSMLSFRDVDGSEQLKELTSDVFDLGENGACRTADEYAQSCRVVSSG